MRRPPHLERRTLGRPIGPASALIVSLALLPGPGCSFVFVEGPPPASVNAIQVECTTSRVLPILDTVGAITQGFALADAVVPSSALVSSADSAYEQLGLKSPWDIATAAALLGTFAASAVVGYSRVSECRQAKAEESAVFVRRHGEEQISELRRLRRSASPVSARATGEPVPGSEGRWPEDDVIAETFGGKVVRSCWLKGAPEPGNATSCILRADFDGDGRSDAAILVVETAEPRRRGIALLASDADRALLGAGKAVGNGGADFGWMDAWRVVKKADATRLLSRASGDALLVEKAESAGGLIGIVDGRPQWTQWAD